MGPAELKRAAQRTLGRTSRPAAAPCHTPGNAGRENRRTSGRISRPGRSGCDTADTASATRQCKIRSRYRRPTPHKRCNRDHLETCQRNAAPGCPAPCVSRFCIDSRNGSLYGCSWHLTHRLRGFLLHFFHWEFNHREPEEKSRNHLVLADAMKGVGSAHRSAGEPIHEGHAKQTSLTIAGTYSEPVVE